MRDCWEEGAETLSEAASAGPMRAPVGPDSNPHALGGKGFRRAIRHVSVQDNGGGARNQNRGQYGNQESAHGLLPDCGLHFSMKPTVSGSGDGADGLALEQAHDKVVLWIDDNDLAGRAHEGCAAQLGELVRQALWHWAQGGERHPGWHLRADDGVTCPGR